MRLLGIKIEDFRSISGQWLPADGLVVLFGPNSAGKTFVLDAAGELLRHGNSRRIDPGVREEVWATGSVWFSLPGAGIDGSPDAGLYRALLNGQYAGGTAWELLAPGAAEVVKDMTADDAREWIASRFAETGAEADPDAGPDADRELLARAMLDHTAAFFVAGDGEVFMYADATGLPGRALEAAARIAAAAGHDDDTLRDIAGDLIAGQVPLIGSVADEEEFAGAFPPVIVLDGDTESLAAELREGVAVIHNRLWAPREPTAAGEVWGLTDGFPIDSYQRKASRRAFDHLVVDSWLERMLDSGEPEFCTQVSKYGRADEWYRVRSSVIAVAAMVEEEANRVAPGFLRSQGEIGVEVLPVSVWGPADRRIRVTFTGRDGEARDLRVVGAGTARWAAAAVQLACRRLRTGRRVVTDQAGLVVSDPAIVREILKVAREQPFSQSDVTLEPADAPGVYVIDEPEAHLHPSAIASVRAWIEELARTEATVLTATHSPMLLDTDSFLTTRVMVRPGEGQTQLRPLTGVLDEHLEETVGELGITKGDLLLMTRLALFVEGPHDAIIFTEWFGHELREAGIRVFPVHGGYNFEGIVNPNPGLVGSEIIAALGIRLAAISDTSPSRGEEDVARLVRAAHEENREVIARSLSAEDILFYLDEEICRKQAPDFPGWQAARAAARHARERNWKKWIRQTYGLELTREGIAQLAAECKKQGCIPGELTQIVNELTAVAASRAPSR